MAFLGDLFIFDDIPSDYYGLSLYSFESRNVEDSESGHNLEIIEDRVPRSVYPISYGDVRNKPLEFELTFGADVYLDKYDVEIIAAWLTEQDDYKYLEIVQTDMENVRYRCKITSLKNIHINGNPVAFKCTVQCDSPYAYSYPCSLLFTIENTSGEDKICVDNLGDSICPIFPIYTIKPHGVDTVTITNASCGNKKMTITNIPLDDAVEITIDSARQTICTNSIDSSPPLLKGDFISLSRGRNELFVAGSCELLIKCEYFKKVGS